nr:FliH/SctL family protein [uncultured Holophaga sp.]
MSRNGRIITAEQAAGRQIEGFPYFAASFIPEPDAWEPDDEEPIGRSLSSPEEDAKRLVSVDHIIHEKLQAAEQQAQEIAQKAYEEGFAAGQAEGRTFGESQYKGYMARFDTHLRELASTLSLLRHASRDEILAMAMAMAEYLAAQQIERSPHSVMPLLQTLLATHPFPGTGEGQTAMQAFLHPKDLELLPTWELENPGIRLMEDPSLSRGSLRLESADGVLDATLERRRQRLLELVERSREEDTD